MDDNCLSNFTNSSAVTHNKAANSGLKNNNKYFKLLPDITSTLTLQANLTEELCVKYCMLGTPLRKVLREPNRLGGVTVNHVLLSSQFSTLGVGQLWSIQWIQLLKTQSSCQQGFLDGGSHWMASYPNALQNMASWNRSRALWCNWKGIFQLSHFDQFWGKSEIVFQTGYVSCINSLWPNQFHL